jgi:hypothetical protein
MLNAERAMAPRNSTFNIQHSTFLVVSLYALLAAIVIPIYPHFPSPNEFSRWFLASAIVEDHTLEVTQQAKPFGRGFEDLSERDGRLYSNKAPGGTLIGLPAFALAHLFTRNVRVTLTAMRLFAATLPTILLALVLARAAARHGAREERINAAVAALLFATPLFAYGLLNFSHALAALCLFAAWHLLFPGSADVSPATGERAGRPRSHDFAAGALLGLAVLAEYPCAIPAAVLLACALPRWRTIARVVAGGIPSALILAAYNELAFGNPFTLSSGNERNAAFRSLASSGMFGIGIPNPLIMLRLLFDPSKGLFVFSPILILALFAIPRAWRRLERAQFWALILPPLSLLFLYSGYPNWHGGWTVGARYLVPALPFIVFLLTLFDEQPVIEPILIGWSAVAVITTSLVFPFVPEDVPFPWATFAMPLLRHGLVAPNLFHLIARPLAIVVPFALAFGAVIIATKRRALLAIGALLALMLVVITPPPRASVGRGFIEEVYFEQSGAIKRATPQGVDVMPSFKARAVVLRLLPPESWPF